MYQRYWDEFVCFAVHVVDGKASFLPASPCLVRCFCQALGDERKAPSTIHGYLASIAGVHNSAGYPDPTSNYLTRKHIKNLTKTIGGRPEIAPQGCSSCRVLHLPPVLIPCHVCPDALWFLAYKRSYQTPAQSLFSTSAGSNLSMLGLHLRRTNTVTQSPISWTLPYASWV